MTEKIKKSLQKIEDQLYEINARNISMRWIGKKKTPTMEEIKELNELLGFIIQEIRTLRETGNLNSKKVHRDCFGE